MHYKLLLTIFLSAPLLLSGQIFSSGFEKNNGPLEDWTIYNLDSAEVPFWAPVPEFNDAGWIQFFDAYDNKIAFSTSLYEGNATANDWLITPSIQLPGDGTPTLYWKAKSYAETDGYAVMVSTTTLEPAAFDTLFSIYPEVGYEFTERQLDLSAYRGQEIYIAFVNNSTGGYYLALDDVYISNSADCYMPDRSTFEVTSFSDTEATFKWEPSDGIRKYAYGLTTFLEPVAAFGATGNTTVSFTDLQPGTRYQLFVKNAGCGSGWAGPKSVFTAAHLPYSYGFEPTEENYGEYDSDGWSSTEWFIGASVPANSGETYLYTNTSTGNDTDKWIYSYPIALDSGVIMDIEFYGLMETDSPAPGDLQVAISDSIGIGGDSLGIGADTINLDRFAITEGAWKAYSTSFEAPATGIYYVAFGHVTPQSESSKALRIDDVRFTSRTVSNVREVAKEQITVKRLAEGFRIDSREPVVRVDIHDMQGRLLASYDDYQAGEVLPLQSEAGGIYLVSVHTASAHKTVRLAVF